MLCAILLATLSATEPDGGPAASPAPGSAEVISAADAGAPLPAVAEQPVRVKIVGAVVLPEAAYLDVLRLPPEARAGEATARDVGEQLQVFLHRLGYELAIVEAFATAGGIEVHVDEGKIDRIIYLGRLSFPQLRFKLGLVLPYGVFNRYLFERQVEELSEELNIRGVEWQLVRTSVVSHEGPQLAGKPGEVDVAFAGITLLRARRPYEVRISFPEAIGSQVGLDLRAYYIDGLEVGLSFVASDLLGDGDRWYTAISGGLGMRARIGADELYPYFSRAAVAARYDTVPIFKIFTPNVWTQVSLVDRHRPDLNLDSYSAFTVDAALQLELELSAGVRFLVGGGYQYRRLSAFEAPKPHESLVGYEPIVRSRPFLRATQAWVINPQVLRWDRRHTVESELRYFFPYDVNSGFGWWDLRYQYVKEIGWHDIWVKSRAHLSLGDVSFHDELSVAEFARGLYVGQWVPSGAALLLEFRFSLMRDTVKVGVFHDLAIFAPALLTEQAGDSVGVGNGFGPSLHLLLFDMIQLDTYVGFGFRRNMAPNASFSLILEKAF